MMQVFGRSAWYMRAIHILCAPTSLMTMSWAASAWRRSQMIFCGFTGKAELSRCSSISSTIVCRSVALESESDGDATCAMASNDAPMSPTMPASTM